MRTTLIAGLLENLRRSQSRFLSKFGQFEVARTYHDMGDELPLEVLKAAAVMYGPAETWIGEAERMLDFFDLKGILERFLWSYTGGGVDWVKVDDVPMLHPKRSLALTHGGKRIGFIGELHPSLLTKMKLHRGVLAFELELYDIWKARTLPAAVALPEFPPMSRDVALLLSRDTDSGAVISAFRGELGEIAEEIRIFDVYTGEHIPADKKSLAFSIVYRSGERTLTDKEVDTMHGKAVSAVSAKFDAVQR